MFLACYYSEHEGFDFYSNANTGYTSMQFFKNGDAFAGNGQVSPLTINLNASNGGSVGVARVSLSMNLETNKFTLQHSVQPSQQGLNLGLIPSSRYETGTCYPSLEKKIP